MSLPDLDNYFDIPNKSIGGQDNKLVLGGTARLGGIEFTADRIGQILDNATVNTIVAKDASDLLVIDSTKNYLVDGVIDMGDQPIIVPPGGISIGALNGARDTSKLISSADNYSLFTTEGGSYSGSGVMDNLTIEVTGTNSQVFNVDNAENGNAWDITGTNFVSCTSLGQMTDYRQMLMNNVGFIFINDGLTFNGNWSGGMAVLTSIAVGFPAATLFKEGTDLLISGSVRSDINFLSVDDAAILFDFQPSNIVNDGAFSLVNVRTDATDVVPNTPGSNVKARFSGCLGVRNTYVGGEWTVSSEVETTISTISTLVKAAGVTSYADLQHFSQTTNNAFVYDSDQVIETEIKGAISLSGTNNNVIGVQLRLWDDSASAYVNLGARFAGTMNASGRVENLAFFAHGALDQGDRVELWLENQTSTANVTLGEGGFVGVSERQS